MRFLKLLILFENFYGACYIFSCHLPSKTFAFLRAQYAMYTRYMFTVGFQCNFRKITARFSAGRPKQLVVNDMLLFMVFLV